MHRSFWPRLQALCGEPWFRWGPISIGMVLVAADSVFIALGSAAYPGTIDLWIGKTAPLTDWLSGFIPAIDGVRQHVIRRGYAPEAELLTHMLAVGWTVTAAVVILSSLVFAATPLSTWQAETLRVGGRKKRVQGFLASIVVSAVAGSMLFFGIALTGTHRRALSGDGFDAVILAFCFIAEMGMAVAVVGTAIGALVPPASPPLGTSTDRAKA
jgi:hypothetical protein